MLRPASDPARTAPKRLASDSASPLAHRPFDNRRHLAEIPAMLTISFARLKLCKGSLQTG